MRLVNNAITGVTYIPTEGHPGTVTRVKRAKPQEAAVQTPDATGTQTGKSRQKTPAKKHATTQQHVAPKKTKKPARESLNVSCKIVTTAPSKNPVTVRYDRKRTLALKRKRQDKQTLQEISFIPTTPDKADQSEAFLEKTVKTMSNISSITDIVLKSPVGTFDGAMMAQLAEIMPALQYIHNSINYLPEATQKAKNRTLNFVKKAIHDVKKTRRKISIQKTR